METEQQIATAEPIEPERMPSLLFLRETFRLYHSNMWLFLKLILPAVIFGHIAVYLGQQRATEIVRQIPFEEFLNHKLEIVEIVLSRLAGYGVSWVVYCFAFAGVCVAVQRIESPDSPQHDDFLSAAREHLKPLLCSSLILFFILVVLFQISLYLGGSVLAWMIVHLHISGSVNYLISAFFSLLVFLVVSKFALAIPAIVLDGHGITKSLFVSDEMTAGRWGSLAVLLLESVGGSYLAWMLPFWIASLFATKIAFPAWSNWALYVIGLIGSAILVPNMLVGFALLYVRTRRQQKETAVPASPVEA